MWFTGLVAPRHVGSSQTRARTRVPCIGRQILNHCATREAPYTYSFILLINTLLVSLILVFVGIHFYRVEGPGALSLATGPWWSSGWDSALSLPWPDFNLWPGNRDQPHLPLPAQMFVHVQPLFQTEEGAVRLRILTSRALPQNLAPAGSQEKASRMGGVRRARWVVTICCSNPSNKPAAPSQSSAMPEIQGRKARGKLLVEE